ncbi:MAG: carboxypeptidase-like regulatory domain-containing protein [Planctomycetaceae bacterium]|jgi:hypothetical protein|nr:carboxypeptidase-like regulatory domain-containing protein [Planctomycetaceae bacterium]
MYIYFLPIMILFATFCSGCGGVKTPDGMPKLFPCEVVVTQEGQPLTGATITVQSADSPWNATGGTDTNGKAVLFTQGKYSGVPAGKYKVIVNKTVTEKEPSTFEGKPATKEVVYYLVEEKYQELQTSPLEIEITSGGESSFQLDAGKAVKNRIPER